MNKQSGAFLTIGELAAELNVPQHILRYWETRFPSLRPLQRAGNRRYYRAEDVELVRRIHRLLNVEGYTIRGAQLALEGKTSDKVATAPAAQVPAPAEAFANGHTGDTASGAFLARLETIRSKLEAALS